MDGTEIAALLFSKKSSALKVGDVILILNIFIFTVAASVLGVEPAMYSILTYFAASRTIDFILHGIEEYTAIIINSENSEEIRMAITGSLSRGLTVYQGRGGLTDQPRDILYCVVTRLEIGKIKAVVREIDKHAFIVVHPLADAEGGMFRASGMH